jgi:site-specific DNA-adenine methylase
MIKIKENIFNSINNMNTNELAILYEQIRFLERGRSISSKKRQRFSIDQILQMTSSSNSKWSDTVIEEREDRV